MKIALLTDGIYPYAMGGMQKHSYYLAKYLALSKIHVDLYHFSQNDKYDIHKLEFFSDEEKKYLRSIIVPFEKLGKLPGHYVRESYQYSTCIYNELKKNPKVDFIYVQGFTGWKIIEQKKIGEKLPPLALNFHGIEPFQRAPDIRSKLQQKILIGAMQYNLKNADWVFSLGGNLTTILIKEKIAASKITQIPIGLEEEWITPKIKERGPVIRFVFTGRYERRKGIEELNRALKRIDGIEKFEFHFIGPIPESKRLISKQVTYYGSIIEQEEIRRIVESCDVLVCPSYSEGMPTVILEAMASGLAVIATDVGAVNELVSAKNGWLLSNPSINLITDALKIAIATPSNKLMEMKKNSRNLIQQKHLWKNIIAQTIKAIKDKI